MSNKIIEIIPDDLPAWAIEAMAKGQLFNFMSQRIKDLEEESQLVTKGKGILKEVLEERWHQDQKWGEQNHPPADWLMILGEEVGEANKAALEAKFKGPGQNETLKDYRAELVQVAAVAVAAIECLDRGAFARQPAPVELCKVCGRHPVHIDGECVDCCH